MSVTQLIEFNTEERRRTLGESLGLDDPCVVRVLDAFGLDATCGFLVAWLPAIELAWRGGLSHTERKRLADDIHARHGTLSVRGDELVEDWLRRPPSAALFRTARRALRAQLAALPPDERAGMRARIMGPCVNIAEASGGVLGFGTISPTELTWLDTLARALRAPDEPSAATDGRAS